MPSFSFPIAIEEAGRERTHRLSPGEMEKALGMLGEDGLAHMKIVLEQ